MANSDPLSVWLYGVRVAELTKAGPGRIQCRYTKDALSRWDLGLPLLSCSLRLTARRLDASAFFRGLLPEGVALAAMASEAGVPSFDTYGLLARFGRDVAGAAVITKWPEPARVGSVDRYTTDALDADVERLDDHPLALHPDSELSLPGLQNKLLLVRIANGWGRPIGGFPSTHILKVEDRRFPGLVAHEAAALALGRYIGLTSITAQVTAHAGLPCIIVDRFDRTPDTTRPAPDPDQAAGQPTPHRRLHQEDFCQALGIDAEAAQGRGKYESAGGPSLRNVVSLLEQHSADPQGQLDQLLRVVVFTVCIGNADAHGKNLALLHRAPATVELAPLYDTVPTALFPALRHECAMRVNGRTLLTVVTGDDLVAEAGSWRMPPRTVRAIVADTLERLVTALDEPTVARSMTDQLAQFVRARCHALTSTLSPTTAD